jgi:hypothetical protein
VTARMRYPSPSRQPSLRDIKPQERAADLSGDAPITMPPPPSIVWSLESYPYPDPALAARLEAEGLLPAQHEESLPDTHGPIVEQQHTGPRRRRRTRGGDEL